MGGQLLNTNKKACLIATSIFSLVLIIAQGSNELLLPQATSLHASKSLQICRAGVDD
jgi:hypothetical protein